MGIDCVAALVNGFGRGARRAFAMPGELLTNFKKCDIIELKGGREGPLRRSWPLSRSGLDKIKKI